MMLAIKVLVESADLLLDVIVDSDLGDEVSHGGVDTGFQLAISRAASSTTEKRFLGKSPSHRPRRSGRRASLSHQAVAHGEIR